MKRLFTDDRWNGAFESFITSIFNISGSTSSRDRYESVMRAFFGSDPARRPENYTRSDVEAFLARPSSSGRNYGKEVAIGTRNQRLAILASWFKFCATYTLSGEDGQPTALLQRLPPTIGMGYGKPIKRYRALSIPEVQALFSVIGHDARGLRDRCMYLWLLLTAKRRTELTELSFGDIEPGNPNMFLYYPKGSHRQQKRQELPQEVYDALMDYLRASNRQDSIKPSDPLFLSAPPRRGGNYRNTGKRLSGHALNKNLQMYCRLAGLADVDRISAHSLRHSSARLRMQSGQDIASISRILGHASLATTSHYLEDLSGISDPGLPMLAKSLPFLYHGSHVQ